MSYDTKCDLLARTFLAEESGYTEKEVAELAQAIQDCIEDYLRERREGA